MQPYTESTDTETAPKPEKISLGRQINALECVMLMLVSHYENGKSKKDWPESDFEQKRSRMREVQSAIRTLQLVQEHQEPIRQLLLSPK